MSTSKCHKSIEKSYQYPAEKGLSPYHHMEEEELDHLAAKGVDVELLPIQRHMLGHRSHEDAA